MKYKTVEEIKKIREDITMQFVENCYTCNSSMFGTPGNKCLKHCIPVEVFCICGDYESQTKYQPCLK